MSGHKARIGAIQAIIAGSPIPPPLASEIHNEFERVYQAGRIRRADRKLLLQVLHSTRGLDTGLTEYIRARGGAPPHSLGPMLYFLRNTGLHGNKLPEPHRQQFQADIVDKRNVYLPNAGQFPSSVAELSKLRSDMQTCLTIVFRL